LRRLILFFIANICFATGPGFHAFLYNFYLEGLNLSPGVMGRAAASWSLGGLAALIPAGRGVDRWGPRPVLGIAALCGCLGLTWGAFATEPATIYLASVLGGGAGVTWRVAQAPILMDLSTQSNRSRLFTLDVAVLVATGAAATALAGALVGRIQPAFHLSRGSTLTLVMVAGALLTGVSAFIYASLDLGGRRQAQGSFAGPAVIPGMIVLLIALSGLWLAGITLAAPFFNVYFSRRFGLPIQQVGWIFSASTITTAILLTGAGEIATRFGARRAFVLWLALFAPAMWGLSIASSVGVAAACYLIQGLVSPAANPLLDQLLFENVPAERRGVVSSWRQAMASVGQVIAQSLGGSILAAGSFAILFRTAGAIGLVAGAAVAFVAWRLGRR
jgi:MFS family permease